MKRFKVISLFTNFKCSQNPPCKGCYVQNITEEQKAKRKPDEFWYDLVPYLSQLTNQVAFASFEPLLFPDFAKEFSKRCKANGLICNCTTNGKLIKSVPKDMFKDITMVSVSFDNNKYPRYNLKEYAYNIKHLREECKVKHIGCNLLLDKYILDNLEGFCKILFKEIKVERIFLLIPKPKGDLDVLKYRFKMMVLSLIWRHLYLDDCLCKVITENKYEGWKESCHFGKSMISINFDSGISGCSFNPDKAFYLDKPSDLLKIKDYKFERRYSCPYL